MEKKECYSYRLRDRKDRNAFLSKRITVGLSLVFAVILFLLLAFFWSFWCFIPCGAALIATGLFWFFFWLDWTEALDIGDTSLSYERGFKKFECRYQRLADVLSLCERPGYGTSSGSYRLLLTDQNGRRVWAGNPDKYPGLREFLSDKGIKITGE